MNFYAAPAAMASSNVFSPFTMAFTTFNAFEKSSKRICGISCSLQYAAKSLSPPGFALTKRTSAWRAAEISTFGHQGQVLTGIWRDMPETPSPKKNRVGGFGSWR